MKAIFAAMGLAVLLGVGFVVRAQAPKQEILLELEITKSGSVDVALAGDDDVIEDGNAEEIAGDRKRVGDGDIGFARGGIGAADSVREDDRVGVGENGDSEDVARLKVRRNEEVAADFVVADDALARRHEEHSKDL